MEEVNAAPAAVRLLSNDSVIATASNATVTVFQQLMDQLNPLPLVKPIMTALRSLDPRELSEFFENLIAGLRSPVSRTVFSDFIGNVSVDIEWEHVMLRVSAAWQDPYVKAERHKIITDIADVAYNRFMEKPEVKTAMANMAFTSWLVNIVLINVLICFTIGYVWLMV